MSEQHQDLGGDERALCDSMAGYQEGHLEAFEHLYAALEHELRAFFRRQWQDAAHIEDLLQETFLQIHRSRRGYLRGRPVRPWVYAIARRVVLMHARRVRRREFPEKTRLQDVPEPASAATDEGLDARSQLTKALKSLPSDGRRALLMHHWLGFSFGEIAGRLQIDAGAAKVRSSRAVARLKRLLMR